MYDKDLPFEVLRATGGTCVMWKPDLDPYILVLTTSSPSVLPVLFAPPGYLPYVHVGIYLPTS